MAKVKILSKHFLREDAAGSGKFGASRDGGKRKHAGVDLLVEEGEIVLSPISGKITKHSIAYPDTDKWRGIKVRNPHTNVEWKILYCTPLVDGSADVGDWVSAGEPIAVAQAISEHYGGAMQDHLHIEKRINGLLVDPTKDLAYKLVKKA